jgi:hypothetical protein
MVHKYLHRFMSSLALESMHAPGDTAVAKDRLYRRSSIMIQFHSLQLELHSIPLESRRL